MFVCLGAGDGLFFCILAGCAFSCWEVAVLALVCKEMPGIIWVRGRAYVAVVTCLFMYSQQAAGYQQR